MCGIAGALVFKNSNFIVTPAYIMNMRDVMDHRGPDGAGLWIDEKGRFGLGHRRLSIIDLSESATQPMSNENETLWVSFNGEIYNHQEIRAELEAIGGHRWKTDHSDTEVIIHAFEQWGIECLHRFRGMFAIALWDSVKRELWLIRDRIGIKPLYYSIHHGRIVFASEIKALLQDPEQNRAVNEEALYHFLTFITTPAPLTLFEGIGKLAGGTWLKVHEDGRIQENRYWDVWDHTEPLTGVSEDEIAHRIVDELRTTVRYRKVSDVPVGVFLSGGIDSSTNAAFFSEGEKNPVKTFTIGYVGEYQSYKNEGYYAKKMADILGAEHHEKLLTIDDLLDFLPRMVWLQDEPIADPVCIPVYYVSKLARDNGVIVCQVGEGADELFWGYPWWKSPLNAANFSDYFLFPWLKNIGMSFLKDRPIFRNDFKLEWLRRISLGQPIFWGGCDIYSDSQKATILSPRLRQKFKNFSTWEALQPIRKRFEEKAWEKSNLNWMSYADLSVRLPELLLMRVDKMSMGVSLECRVPFLDHKFVELAMSIPEKVKTKNGVTKYILKKAVRGIIPDELIDRPKQGFGVPVYEWFFDRLGEKSRTEMNSFCDKTDFLDKKQISQFLDNGQGVDIWFLLNFALWWKEYIGS
ncbi:asparagine synthase (glutamine-hydrolyzing) [bacterium]|nr:asparagine synthase (glutamine-hydrolyzing) [bacterium]